MPYVMPREGYQIVDLERHNRLPAGKFRPVPASRYWSQMARMGDVVMRDEVPPELVEGYEPPAPPVSAPADAEPAAAKLTPRKGSDA